MIGRTIAVALLLGCTGCSMTAVQPVVETTGMPNVELALQHALAQVDADVGHLGMMQPGQEASSVGVVPAELQKQMTLQWSGPLDGAVRRVGQTVGYQVTVQTLPDGKPLPIAIDRSGQAVDLLRSIGEQAGARATVAVDPLHHQITVTHHV